MISIIICSRHTNISEELKVHIQATIGVEYELIVIDNSENKYSIFSAYNEGVRRAKYPYLCFMHEDILYHTYGWGKKVIEHFKNPKVGIIGVAGSHYLPKLPGSHWSTGITSYNILHSTEGKIHFDSWRLIDNEESSIKAVLVDGVWFCIPKTVMTQIRFDELTFNGFHAYDSDICLQIKQLNFEVRIVFDIKIEHFSLGKRDQEWLKAIFILFHKWKGELPICVAELSKYKISEANFWNAHELIEQIRINQFGKLNILKVWFYYIRLNPVINRRNLRYCKMLLKETFSTEVTLPNI
jgi:hypothetical protein